MEHSEEILVQVQSAVAPLAKIIHEVRDDMRKHVENETIRIQSIDDRLDKHLEIYANNGKEAKRVADNLVVMLEHSKERDKKVDEMNKKTEEMYKQFQEERIVAAADKKRLQSIVLYGSVGAALMAIVAFGKWLIR